MPGAGRVYEAPGAGVDADVIDRTPRTDTEENQVTRSKLRKRDGPGCALLSGGGARNRKPSALMNVQSQPAAVEASRVRSAEVIRRTNERCGDSRDDGTLIGRREWRRRRSCQMRWMRCAAHPEHGRNEQRRDEAEDPRRGTHSVPGADR